MRHRRQGLRGGLDQAGTARHAHRQEGGRRRLRPGRAGRGGPAQSGGALGHRLRAGRSRRRSAHVRHSQHEARQELCPCRRVDLLEEEGIEFIPNCEVGVKIVARRSCVRISMPLCCAAAPPSRAICRSRAATCRASTSPWSSCTPTPRACSTRPTRTAASSMPGARTWS